ncbi:MAG: glycoside hydrolase [Crocinitomicaceae bacterium]|nr:glycoside hydrolase [Crocinitomicaceae bacterium]|tara:strand:+ start:20793 stop:21749 length:957 start_codon:yes stop_codon:yes gene_type:complete
MSLLRNTLLNLFVFIAVFSNAQTRQTPKQYIEKFDQDAVNEMIRSGVPASITLAQGMLESDYGNSQLAKKARNHFGIKCHSKWKGKRFYMDDDAKHECFRVYNSVYDSYVDHSNFLKRNQRYSFLFDLKRTDYKGWAKGLKKAGYATNPKYPALLIGIIEKNNLARFDKMTKSDVKKLGASTKGQNSTFQSEPISKSGGQPSTPKDTKIRISKNKIKFVYSQPGDTPKKIADRYDLGHWQILNYNDVKRDTKIPVGTPIYLQPKRNKFKGGGKYHIVKKGESLWKISQMYGIKLKKLAKRNGLEKGQEPKAGTKLKLK